MAGWRAWRRNEIENYLIEPSVALPVMARWFACSEGAVLDGLGQVVAALRVCQATDRAFYQVERLLADRCGPGRLRGHVSRRPSWVAEDPYLSPPEAEAVRRQATAAVSGCIASCEGHGDLPTTALSAFETALDEGLAEWTAVTSEDESWRVDWAGKEVLQHLRMLLAARHGWIAQGSTEHPVVAWHALNRRDRDALDRDMEREMHGELVARFLQWLEDDPATDVAREWRELAETVAEAARG